MENLQIMFQTTNQSFFRNLTIASIRFASSFALTIRDLIPSGSSFEQAQGITSESRPF